MLRDIERAISPVCAKTEKTFHRSVLDTPTTRELEFVALLAEFRAGRGRFSDVAARLGVPTEKL